MTIGVGGGGSRPIFQHSSLIDMRASLIRTLRVEIRRYRLTSAGGLELASPGHSGELRARWGPMASSGAELAPIN